MKTRVSNGIYNPVKADPFKTCGRNPSNWIINILNALHLACSPILLLDIYLFLYFNNPFSSTSTCGKLIPFQILQLPRHVNYLDTAIAYTEITKTYKRSNILQRILPFPILNKRAIQSLPVFPLKVFGRDCIYTGGIGSLCQGWRFTCRGNKYSIGIWRVKTSRRVKSVHLGAVP